jgi:hypothetical protein
MTIVTDDNTAIPGGGYAERAVERALAAAIRDPGRIGELLQELSRGRLWLPLPDDGRPVTDGSAVNLPIVTYLGSEFVPAFTSAARLLGPVPRPRTPNPAVHVPAPAGPAAVTPHIVVPAAALARLLPPDVGIALNPDAGESVPVYPEGVAYLAAVAASMAAGSTAPGTDLRSRVSVGPPPALPDRLLQGIASGLPAVRAASQASAAWLSVEFAGEGLVISVTLDDPKDSSAQDAVILVVERAAQAAAGELSFPVDVTFPGEGAPDPVDEWISASAVPFYRRT